MNSCFTVPPPQPTRLELGMEWERDHWKAQYMTAVNSMRCMYGHMAAIERENGELRKRIAENDDHCHVQQ